jgi:hypothetical protein
MRRYRLFEVTKLPAVITSSLRRVIRHEYTSLALYDHDHQGHAYARARLSPASSSRCFHDAAGSGRFFMPAIENSSMRSKEIPHNILVELARRGCRRLLCDDRIYRRSPHWGGDDSATHHCRTAIGVNARRSLRPSALATAPHLNRAHG